MSIKLRKKAKRAAGAALSALALSASSLTFSMSAKALEPVDPQVYQPVSDWQSKPHGTKLKQAEIPSTLLTSFTKEGFTQPLRAWRISYATTAPHENLNGTLPGRPQLATGIILVPTTAWTRSATRPVVVFAPKTQGIGSECAPSKALEFGREEKSEVLRMITALQQGYVVAVTDYDGYSNGVHAHQYLVGQANGHAVLDMALATKTFLSEQATTIGPALKLSASAPFVIWGYSEGGSAAAWAGQLVSGYAPSLLSTLKAVASGGPVADLQSAAVTLDASPGAALLLSGVWGFHNAYPKPFSEGGIYFDMNNNFKRDLLGDQIANYTANPPTTTHAGYLLHPASCIDTLSSVHVMKSMVWRNNGLAGFNNGEPFRITQLTSMPELRWNAVMTANNPGSMNIPVPFYFYHGSWNPFLRPDGSAIDGDGMVSATSFNNFFNRLCSTQTDVWKEVVPSNLYGDANHETASDRAFASVIGWLDKALMGQPLSFTSPRTVGGVSTTRRCQ